MQDLTTVTGMIIKQSPVGDYDRRVVILTSERGKIAAFVRGARRVGSRFMASTDIFCFGSFTLYPGRSAYTLNDARIDNYFESLRTDYAMAYLGIYFLEIADYYTRENNDDTEMLKLLYQSIRALGVKSLDKLLIRAIYEIKSIVINGEFPGIDKEKLLTDTKRAIEYIVQSSIEKLYTFAVGDEVLKEITAFATKMRSTYIGNNLKTLEMLP